MSRYPGTDRFLVGPGRRRRQPARARRDCPERNGTGSSRRWSRMALLQLALDTITAHTRVGPMGNVKSCYSHEEVHQWETRMSPAPILI